MSVHDLITAYIEAHTSPQPKLLAELDRATNTRLVNGRMCSGHLQGRLLKMLVQMVRPRRVLELGTFSGYSALCIAEGLEEGATLDTVEIDDELEDFIRFWLGRSEHGHKIRLHIGDALHVVGTFEDNWFDMAFIDADKRTYPQTYEAVLPKIIPGGYILADNTLWDGHVVEIGTHAAQTQAILDFNALVSADERVEQVMIPLRDGLTIIRKLPQVEQ
ncbi:MAG: O-methyltransferase [Muribaculaceae bacterium]|nr:O-methyltransferase [Muribaculaceae bacterium]